MDENGRASPKSGPMIVKQIRLETPKVSEMENYKAEPYLTQNISHSPLGQFTMLFPKANRMMKLEDRIENPATKLNEHKKTRSSNLSITLKSIASTNPSPNLILTSLSGKMSPSILQNTSQSSLSQVPSFDIMKIAGKVGEAQKSFRSNESQIPSDSYLSRETPSSVPISKIKNTKIPIEQINKSPDLSKEVLRLKPLKRKKWNLSLIGSELDTTSETNQHVQSNLVKSASHHYSSSFFRGFDPTNRPPVYSPSKLKFRNDLHDGLRGLQDQSDTDHHFQLKTSQISQFKPFIIDDKIMPNQNQWQYKAYEKLMEKNREIRKRSEVVEHKKVYSFHVLKRANKIKQERTILVLHGDIRYNLQLGEVSIPVYDKIYDGVDLRKDFEAFLKVCEDALICSKDLKCAFLLSGAQIYSLADIPLEVSFIVVDHIPALHLRERYVDYHHLPELTDDKWNLLLYLLSIQKSIRKVKLLLQDEKFHSHVMRNENFHFSNLMENHRMSLIERINATPEMKYKDQVQNSVLSMRAIVEYADALDEPTEKKTELVIQTFDKLFRKIRDQYEKKINPTRFRNLKILEDMFTDVDIFLRERESRGIYIHILDNAIAEEPDIKKRMEIRKKRLPPIDFDAGKKTGNYILKNKRETQRDEVKVYSSIFKNNSALSELNIPKWQAESDFDRRSLHKLYIKYKALTADFGFKKMMDKGIFDPTKGFDLPTFQAGFSQFEMCNEKLVNQIFTYGGDTTLEADIDWPQFLRLMMAVRSKSLKDKVGLFLRIIDMDGNGNLSYDEVREVCASALKYYRKPDNDPLMDQLTDFFAKMVFDAVGVKLTDEIPIMRLKKIVDNGIEAVDLLLKYSGAEVLEDEEQLLENNCMDKKMPKIGYPQGNYGNV